MIFAYSGDNDSEYNKLCEASERDYITLNVAGLHWKSVYKAGVRTTSIHFNKVIYTIAFWAW